MDPELLEQLEARCDGRALQQPTTKMMLDIIAARSVTDGEWVNTHRAYLVESNAKEFVRRAGYVPRQPPILNVAFTMTPRNMDIAPDASEQPRRTADVLLQQQHDLDLLNQMV